MKFLRPLKNSIAILGLLVTAGCGGSTGPQGGPRTETVIVKGLIKVDGAPAASLRVVAVPDGGAGIVPMESSSLTDTEGVFSLSTYESGDGVPAGQYNLTFVWGQINLMNGQYSGDKFKGKYSDAGKSDHSLTIKSGDEAHDLGTIELSTATK